MLGVSGVSVIFGGGLSPDDVGARVSVRHRRPDGVADVIGDLDFLDADRLTIRPSNGPLVVIEIGAVVAARVVGPSARSARDLEAVSARGWPALEHEWLGQWWLRAAGGFTGRANSVRAQGDPGRPLDEALRHVVRWYAERQLPPQVRVIVGSALDREMAARGWTADRSALMLTATIATIRARVQMAPSRPVHVAAEPDAGWLGRYRDGASATLARSLLVAAPGVSYARIDVLVAGAAATAIGRAVVEPPWVGLAAIEVDPAARRQGHARAVVGTLADWAATQGALRGYLEVAADNTAALTFYGTLGFALHHQYLYRTPPGSD